MCLCCVSLVWVENLLEADINGFSLAKGGGGKGSCKTPLYSGWKRKINSFWYQYLVQFLLFPILISSKISEGGLLIHAGILRNFF
jgi:hypothetical protein